MRLIGIIIMLLSPAVLLTFGHGAQRDRVSGSQSRAWRQGFTTGDSSENVAAEFGWGAAVDTNLSFSEFFGHNYTIAARFMLQYERSYQAPILTVKGQGNFLLAVAGYGERRTREEKLLVRIGLGVRYYNAGGRLATERWHWLALVREGKELRLFLDGAELKADDARGDLLTASHVPEGTLRLGRKTVGDEQFYGLMDDVAVFDAALSLKTLKDYYQTSPQLTGAEPGLIAAYTFDQRKSNESTAKATLRQALFKAPALTVPLSATRDSTRDALLLPAPLNRTEVRLPFAPGQTWKVIQGYGQALSHNGGGVFSLDFARVDGPSEEQPVYACAPGRVVAISDNNDPEPGDEISKDNFNYMQMEIAPGELVTYLHMKNGSLIDALKPYAPTSFPGLFAPFALPAGAQVGRVGNTWLKEQPDNWHLHFAAVPYLNSPVSIPLAFTDYELYEPRTRSWRQVKRGVPEQNQIVRRVN